MMCWCGLPPDHGWSRDHAGPEAKPVLAATAEPAGAGLREALEGQREYHLHMLASMVPGSMGEASEREELAEIDAALSATRDGPAEPAEPADEGLREALEAIEQLVGAYDHLGTGSYSDHDLKQMERDADSAWQTVKRAALAAAPSAPAGLDEAHPRTYSLTASGPNGELFLVTDDESGINIGHAKQIGGPLTARLATAPSAPAGLDVEPCPRCAHRSHPPHGCEARYHVTLKKGEAGDPCLCPEAALAAEPAGAGLREAAQTVADLAKKCPIPYLPLVDALALLRAALAASEAKEEAL